MCAVVARNVELNQPGAAGAHRVVVVGAGVIGVTTAHALLCDGHDVTLLEAAPAAGTGASHANGGFLSAAFCAPWAVPGLPKQVLTALFDREAPIRWRPDGSLAQLRWMGELLAQCNGPQFSRHRGHMVRLALFSRACLHAVAAQTAISFDLRETGVLQLFRHAPARQAMRQRLDELNAFGIEAQWCDPDQVRALEPGLGREVTLAGALHVREDASGDCQRFVQALLAWSQAQGLRVVAGTAVEALELAPGRRRLRAVRAASQRWEADAFVFCTGVDTARLLRPHLRLPVVPVKGYSVTVPIGDDAGVRCAVIDDASKLAVTRLGSRLRLAGMAELVGHDLSIDHDRCNQLVRQYEALYGPLPTQGRTLWAGLRPMTPDGPPLIGGTAIEGLYLNTGHGTYGWTLSCGSARLLADVMAGRPTALDAAAYAADGRTRGRG